MSQTGVFHSAGFDGISVTSIWNKTIQLGALEVAKRGLTLKPNTDVEKLLQIMSSQMQPLLYKVNGDWMVDKRLRVVGIKHIGYTIQVL